MEGAQAWLPRREWRDFHHNYCVWRRANSDAHGDSDGDANTHCDSDSDANTHCDSDSDAHSDGDSNGDANAHGDSNGDANAHGDGNGDANAHANTHSDIIIGVPNGGNDATDERACAYGNAHSQGDERASSSIWANAHAAGIQHAGSHADSASHSHADARSYAVEPSVRSVQRTGRASDERLVSGRGNPNVAFLRPWPQRRRAEHADRGFR